MACVSVLLAMGKFVYTPMVVLALLIPWVQRAIPVEGLSVRINCVSSIWRDPRLWICAAGNVLAFLWLFSWLKATSWFVNTPMIVSYDQMVEKKAAMLSGPDGMMEVLRAVFSAKPYRTNGANCRLLSGSVSICKLMFPQSQRTGGRFEIFVHWGASSF